MLRLWIAVSLFGGLGSISLYAEGPVTFNKDILPLLQQNCQTCHRPGEIAPMSLLTYTEARPWAKAMKAAVVSQKMPPWFADPRYGHFANDRRLTEEQIKTIVAWVDAGAPEGNPKDKPAPVQFPEGWNIKPDLVIEMPEPFSVPANGALDYQYVVVKGNFKEDTWVTAAEMRPGNLKVVHHGKVWVRPPGSHWMEHAVPGVFYTTGMGGGEESDGNDILGKFNPGLGPQSFEIGNSAKLIPKGSDLVFEIHYTTTGQPTTDRSKVGLVLAKHPPALRYFVEDRLYNNNFVLRAGDNNAEVVSEATVGLDGGTLVYVQPHMHLRGKDYELRIIYPDGKEDILFKGKFDFNWQLGYDFAKPLPLPKGTRLIGIAHYDNSANNPFNPDPTKDIRWGLQNWDEMSSAFIGIVADVHANPAKLLFPSGPANAKTQPSN